MIEAIAIIIAYLLGSIPSAYIAGRLVKKVDIRKVGGGNMGALNVAREVGSRAGIIVLVADVAKGSVAVLIAQRLGVSEIYVYAAGFAAIIGHNIPIYLKFRGGKGVATSFGVLLMLAPIQVAICLVPMLITLFFTSNVSLMTTAGMVFMLLVLWLMGREPSLILYTMAIAIFQALRYISTAKRNLALAGDNKKSFFFERKYTPWQTRKK